MSRRLIYGFALALLLFPAEVPSVMAANPTQANGHQQPRVEKGQVGDPARLRELREKARSGSLTPEEQKELDAAMAARNGTRPGTAPMPGATRPDVPRDPAEAANRRESYLQRQGESLERMRQIGGEAFKASEARQAQAGPGRDFYVNNVKGDDSDDGLAAEKGARGGPVRTLSKGVSLLNPGDTLHLAVTDEPYRETLTLGDDFGGVPGKPITIDGHGATITGSDPLRWDSWNSAGDGLYKSTKFIDELEEFTDESKLGRVFLVFDGVVQHMDRSMKGKKAQLKAPGALKPGEWTFEASERAFYLRIAGDPAEARVEAPYRRNGVTVRAPKVAATHVIVRNLIVCRVLNDGYNLHGSSRDFLLQNIAALECGDDGISPHETNEVEIDGFWSVGNSTGMGNGYLSKTKARNVRLEGNLGHQLMTGHMPTTELTNAIILASPGTEPINITNSQDTKLVLDNVLIGSPAGQKVSLITKSSTTARRVTACGPIWEVGGSAQVNQCVIAGPVTLLEGGTWSGGDNVFDSATRAPVGDNGSKNDSVGETVLTAMKSPFAGAGANRAEMQIPAKPKPHPKAGKFISLEAIVE